MDRRTVLEDAAQLHAEGAVLRLYNAEFKMDVLFAAPAAVTSVTPELIDTYLKKEVRTWLLAAVGGCAALAVLAPLMQQQHCHADDSHCTSLTEACTSWLLLWLSSCRGCDQRGCATAPALTLHPAVRVLPAVAVGSR
jgi:hypothetical protein